MHSIAKRQRYRSEEEEINRDAPRHPRFSYATWVAIAVGGSAVLGVGASLYGANKQAGAVEDANKANVASQADQNAAAWANYLMTRGVNPAGAVTGQIPTNPQAINARLPLWARGNFATGPSRWRKRGAVGGATNTQALVTPPSSSGGGSSDYTAPIPDEYQDHLEFQNNLFG